MCVLPVLILNVLLLHDSLVGLELEHLVLTGSPDVNLGENSVPKCCDAERHQEISDAEIPVEVFEPVDVDENIQVKNHLGQEAVLHASSVSVGLKNAKKGEQDHREDEARCIVASERAEGWQETGEADY